MISTDIAKRYARAFFDIAQDENNIEGYFKEIQTFTSVVEESSDLRGFLANPIFDNGDKKAVVEQILDRIKISATATNFIRLLVDKERINICREIESAYREQMDLALRRVRVEVKTAFPLSPQLMWSLKKSVAQLTGKEVEMSIEDDRSLIGGIVVRVGDTLYDGSIKTQLNNIRKLLGEEI